MKMEVRNQEQNDLGLTLTLDNQKEWGKEKFW